MMKRCKIQSCSDVNDEEETSELIPLDLIIEILLRFPAKTTARFRCVSKLWDSTIRSPSFTNLFFTKSLSRPNLLFTCIKKSNTLFFSSPQPQNSSLLAVTDHMSFPINYSLANCRPVRGLVCGLNQQVFMGGRRVTEPFLCNPSTGQSLTLPRVKTRRKKVFSYLGYDPIDKQFKVLCMTKSHTGSNLSEEHQVLTLEVGKKQQSWKKIKCDTPHSPDLYDHIDDVFDGICINGVLYYLAKVYKEDGYAYSHGIVYFDIKNEKFKSITITQGMPQSFNSLSTLINYKGKLAMLHPDHFIQMYIQNIQLWVLEDAQNSEWLLSYFYVMLPVQAAWMSLVREAELIFVGMADTGEIVLSPKSVLDSFFLVYLDTENNTLRRVEIQGMEDFKLQKVYTFLDHVENLNLA